jgi:phage host-nuclease inhibitor protein Gam
MFIKVPDQIAAEVVAQADKRLKVTPDASLPSFAAVEARIRELEAIRQDYRRIESGYSASRLHNLARSYRAKMSALKRRISELMDRRTAFPEGMALAHATQAIDAGRRASAMLASKDERGEMIPDPD